MTPTAASVVRQGGTRFYLGTHQPGWLRTSAARLFISDRRLRGYRRLPVATQGWALDSGGFTELQQYGVWTVDPADYVARVRRYQDEVGRLEWAAPQDWMCEPVVIGGGQVGPIRFAGTRLSVAEHQNRTVANYVQLRTMAPDLPFIPVLQGWTTQDYLRCIDTYAAAGIDLRAARLVGLGSVCRRQGTGAVGAIITALHAAGLKRLHGFGFKTRGLLLYADLLASADSMAWSADARRKPALPECTGLHRNCANCPRFAYQWRQRLVTAIAANTAAKANGRQLSLFDLAS